MIGLLGATGYTGRLVVAELARRGLPARLGGRDPDRLAALEPSDDPLTERALVDVADPVALAAFLSGLDAVISCVGPFVKYGDPVVDAAVAAGVPYVDSTGETTFMAGVYDRHANAAVPVVPACGFDYIPGDLGAALAADLAGGEVARVLVGYHIRGMKASRGTARSAVGVINEMRFAPRRVLIDFPGGTRSAVTVPWGEEVTVPRFLPGVHVRTAHVVPSLVAHGLGAVGPALPLAGPLLRFARPVLEQLVERLPEGPPQSAGGPLDTQIVVHVAGHFGEAAVVVNVGDAYQVTAALLVESAVRVAAEGCPTGALTTAQAFEPAEFLDAVSGPLLSWAQLATS
ncbi:MAG: NAD(P)H-binding protein [Frankia sp.]